MNWVADNWLLVVGLLLSAIGVWLLMPRAGGRICGSGRCVFGRGNCVAGGDAASGDVGGRLDADRDDSVLDLFDRGARGAVLMITNRNPVYSALWFALVTLSVCGLFLLQSAPFLAAATIIVYAGAIVVTFVFVIMLAQQSGATVYDQRSRQPLLATVAAFILLGALLSTIETWGAGKVTAEVGTSTANGSRGGDDESAEPAGAG